MSFVVFLQRHQVRPAHAAVAKKINCVDFNNLAERQHFGDIYEQVLNAPLALLVPGGSFLRSA
jgi:hypothetical protein